MPSYDEFLNKVEGNPYTIGLYLILIMKCLCDLPLGRTCKFFLEQHNFACIMQLYWYKILQYRKHDFEKVVYYLFSVVL